MKKKVLCFVAGKSGGHLIPSLTQAQRYQEKDPAFNIIFFTTSHHLDRTIMANYPTITTISFTLETIRPYKIWRFLKYGLQLFHACFKAFKVLHSVKPLAVISMGGYISIPVCLMAKILNIPVELYELNAIPGKAIKTLAPLAKTIHVCFAQAQKFLPAHKCVITSYPIRFSSVKNHNRTLLLQQLHFNQHKKTILICGGSQGSLFLNNMIKKWLTTHSYLSQTLQIIHQTGTQDLKNMQEFYTHNNFQVLVFDYHTTLENYYQLADIIVCRAGAGTLFETMFFQKPCITIPLEVEANGHQVANAQALAQEYPHLITILRQHDITDNNALFATTIRSLLTRATPPVYRLN